MPDDINAALAILERAMGIEQEGHQFYLKAAQATEDKDGQETFATLADDELKHYDLIKRQHTALTNEGIWVAVPEINPVPVDLDRPLFPEGIRDLQKEVKPRSSNRDALLFGLDIEIKSYDLYRKGASETGDPLGRQMFEFLAGQEQSHFDILMMRFDALFGPISWRY